MSETVETLSRAEYRRINNIRYSKPGRPLGKGNLSQSTIASIIIDKNLQLLSQPAIAAKHNVARMTVNQLTEDSLNDEGKRELKSFTDKLGTIREKTAEMIIEKLDDRTMKDGVLPQLLNVANTNYRLETQAPVDALSAANAILSLAQLCKIPDSDRDAFFASAAESFAVLRGVEVGLIVAAAREIEAKQLQAASVDVESIEAECDLRSTEGES